MKYKLNKTNTILWSIVLILSLLFLFSSIFSNEKVSRKPVKTSLLNPKNKSVVEEINIKNENVNINLIKKNDIWFVKNNNDIIPCDEKRIEKFLVELQNLRSLYKITENPKNLKQYGLNSESVTFLSYKVGDKTTKLYFGNYDFSQSFRFFMTDKSVQIYEIDTILDTYINSTNNFWEDSYLISKAISNNLQTSDVMSIKIIKNNSVEIKNSKSADWNEYCEKMLELRHSGFIENENKNPIGKINIEIGNKNKIVLDFFETEKENEFNVKLDYYNSQNNVTNSYFIKVSEWTFNKLF